MGDVGLEDSQRREQVALALAHLKHFLGFRQPLRELPGTGGLKFRCNGKADPTGGAAICSRALFAATLDAAGKPSGFKKLNDDPIPD